MKTVAELLDFSNGYTLDGEPPPYDERPTDTRVEKFSEDQPRDESGRWTSGGGGSGRNEARSPMGGDYPPGTLGATYWDAMESTRSQRIASYRRASEANEAEYQQAEQKLERVLQDMPDVHENVQLDVIGNGGAYFDQKTGEIGVDLKFVNYAREGRLHSVLEHELSHERLHRATANEATAKELSDFVKSNGSAVVDEGRAISDYARAYWKRTEKEYRRAGYDLRGPTLEAMKATAINESLAEMHRRHRISPAYQEIDRILARAPLGKALTLTRALDPPLPEESWPLVFYLDAAGDPVESEADAVLIYTFEREGGLRIEPGPKFEATGKAGRAPVRLDADALRGVRRSGVVYAKHGTPGDPDYPHPLDGGDGGDSGGGISGIEMVSPSVAEHLSFDEAERALHGARQREVMAIAPQVDAIVGVQSHQAEAIGAWSDGAENSIIVTLTGDPTYEQIRVSAAMKGELADQKAVIPFKAEEDGPDAMYVLEAPSTNLKEVHDQLEADGVVYHTLERHAGGTRVWVFDQGTTLGETIEKVGQKYGRQPKQIDGRGEFLGGETRAEGRARYQEVISRNLERDQRISWERLRDNWRETHPVIDKEARRQVVTLDADSLRRAQRARRPRDG